MVQTRAFVVNGGSLLVFAGREAFLRRQIAETAPNRVFSAEIDCRRIPRYDGHAPGPVPIDVLIADGWQFPCDCCGAAVGAAAGSRSVVGYRVFCSPAHRRAWLAGRSSILAGEAR